MLRSIAIALLFLFVTTLTHAQPYEWLRNKPENPGLMIFIHGLTGDADTWASGDTNWPDIVRNDPLFSDMNILLYKYPSSIVGNGFTARGLATRFRHELNSPQFNVGQYDRIVIVAHSLGGIIARQYVLMEAAAGEKGNLRKIKALFLYASPMAGSGLANILNEWPGSPLVRDLRALNNRQRASFLETLHDEWVSKKLGLQVPTYCAYETKKYGGFLFGAMVVQKRSAALLCNADLAEVEEHHVDIVKPKVPKNFYSHTLLSNWYKEVFPSAGRLVEESKSPVLVADCDNDTYGPEFHAALSNDIFAVTESQPRLSPKLPRDWRPAYRALLWHSETPRVVVIHLSCFANGSRTNNAAQNQERTEDFVRFLQTVEAEGVNVLVYSLAFADGTSFLTQYAVADRFLQSGRMRTFATSHGTAYTEDPNRRTQLKNVVKMLLDEHTQRAPR